MRRPTRAALGGTLLLFALQFAIEEAFSSRIMHLDETENSLMARIFQPLASFGPHKTEFKRTSVLRIDAATWPTGLCQRRDYLRRVIERLLEYRPRALVADYTLVPIGAECPNDDTTRLLGRIQDTCHQLPVVFGYDVTDGPSIGPYEPIIPSGGTDKSENSRCEMGYTNLRHDLRLIPLEQRIGDQDYPSLAWAAVRTIERIESKQKIARAAKSDERLFTWLPEKGTFEAETVTDSELFSEPNSEVVKRKLEGRVVVIGFAGGPILETDFGWTPAYLLHAVYIDALMEDRYLQPLPDWLHWGISLVFWFSLEKRDASKATAAWRHSGEPLFALLKGLGLLVLFNLLMMKFLGRYTDFNGISLVGLLLWLIHWIRGAFHEFSRAASAHSGS